MPGFGSPARPHRPEAPAAGVRHPNQLWVRGDVMARCGWVNEREPDYVAYHDHEWGVPLTDGRTLWELSVLEGFQAGLAWITVLKKRPAFRAAFAGFDPAVVAGFGEADIQRLLGDAGIVRSRAKIEAAITSARVYLELEAAGPGFAATIWDVVDGRPVQNAWKSYRDAPVETDRSRMLAALLRQRGVRFFGPVIAYAFMQAAGLVNDHETACPRYEPVRALGEAM
jgi:DNA-3-methyladenine glycosylase I